MRIHAFLCLLVPSRARCSLELILSLRPYRLPFPTYPPLPLAPQPTLCLYQKSLAVATSPLYWRGLVYNASALSSTRRSPPCPLLTKTPTNAHTRTHTPNTHTQWQWSSLAGPTSTSVSADAVTTCPSPPAQRGRCCERARAARTSTCKQGTPTRPRALPWLTVHTQQPRQRIHLGSTGMGRERDPARAPHTTTAAPVAVAPSSKSTIM